MANVKCKPVTISIPEAVYDALEVIARSKGVSLEEFCKSCMAAGLSKTWRKQFR